MGMFDTIYFEKPIICSVCHTEIYDIQTKEFSCILACYQVGDYIKESSDKKIYDEILFCSRCNATMRTAIKSFSVKKVYLAVRDYILVDITETWEEAETAINNFSYEKILKLFYKKSDEQEIIERKYAVLRGNLSRLIQTFECVKKKENNFLLSLDRIFLEKYIEKDICSTLKNLLETNES